MKRKNNPDEQIIGVLKEHEAGLSRTAPISGKLVLEFVSHSVPKMPKSY